ncbi:MAG: PD40 domain-containing protein [Planctomycetes bacterium]|nr:PD40 domain-containing protein [Planctomycetota bacterium]
MPDLTKPSQAWSLTWDADWVTAVAWLGSSRRVAAGNNLGQILLWELPDKPGGDAPRPVARLDGHTNVISRLAATPDGKTLISSSYDHTIRFWAVPSKLPEATEPITLNASAIADAVRRKANGAKAPPALEAKVGVLKPTRTLTEHKEWIVGMGMSRDGKALISGDDGGHVIVWDVATGGVKARWKLAKGWAYAVALSPDAKQACVTERLPLVFDSGRHAAVKLWNAATGEVAEDLSAEKEFKGHHMSAAAYSPDGKTLAILRGGESNGPSGKPVLVDPATGKVLKDPAPGHLDGGTDLAWHPDGHHLASAGRDTTVRVWDTATGKLVSEVGKGRGGQFKDWICAVSWSADGNWLAAADMAGAVQIWAFN